MYIHLGQETVVKTEDVVGIFDMENTTTSRFTREYLKQAEKKGHVINVTTELPKSFIVCNHGGQIYIYISQISPLTLARRSKFIDKL